MLSGLKVELPQIWLTTLVSKDGVVYFYFNTLTEIFGQRLREKYGSL